MINDIKSDVYLKATMTTDNSISMLVTFQNFLQEERCQAIIPSLLKTIRGEGGMIPVWTP